MNGNAESYFFFQNKSIVSALGSHISLLCHVLCDVTIPSIYFIARDMITGWHSRFGLACTA
jgi:hypothetical protein